MTESRLTDEVDLELQSAFWAATWRQLFAAPCIPASLAGPTAKCFCQQIQAERSGFHRPISWVPTETTNLEFALMKFLRLDRSR